MSLKTVWRTGSVTEIATTDKEGIGNLRWDGRNLYRWVKNVQGSAITVGESVCYILSDDAHLVDADDVEAKVLQPTTGNLHRLAGIVVAASVADDEFCWILVQGYHGAICVEGTTDISVGDDLKGETATNYLVKGAGVGVAATYRNHVVALEAFATNAEGTIKGIVNCF